MHTDTEFPEGQPVPLREQYALAAKMVDILLDPKQPEMSAFVRDYILERQLLDYAHPFDEDARHG